MKKILLILAVLMINTSLTMAQKASDAQTIRQKLQNLPAKRAIKLKLQKKML